MTSPELRERVLREAARTPSPTRAETTRRTTSIVVLGVLATAGLFFGTGRYVQGPRSVALVALTIGTSLVVALALTATLRSSRSMLGPSRSVLLAAGGAGAAVLALVAALAPSVLEGGPGVSRVTDLVCGTMTLVQSLLPLAVLAIPRRGSDPVHPLAAGAALGVAAGAWGAAMAYVRCPHGGAAHSVLAHALPALALAVVGALLGRALLRVK